MKSDLWVLGAVGAVVVAALYYAAKPVAKLTFYDPEIITTVGDPPTVITADDVDAVTG